VPEINKEVEDIAETPIVSLFPRSSRSMRFDDF
jgi:hypothetical protein